MSRAAIDRLLSILVDVGPRPKPAERALLEALPTPIVNPDTQDYAVWRRAMLRQVLVGLIVQTSLLVLSFFQQLGEPTLMERLEERLPAAVRALRPAPEEAPPDMTAGFIAGLAIVGFVALGSAGLGLAAVVLVVMAAWQWHRVGLSRQRVVTAWGLWFFAPLPFALVPYSWLPIQSGFEAWLARVEQVWTTLSYFLPTLFALLPAVLRASLRLTLLLPETGLPARLARLAAPFCSAGYLVVLSILLQFEVNRYLVLGFAFLALSSAPHWFGAGALLQCDTQAAARRAVRWISWMHALLLAGGVVCLGRFFWGIPYVDLLLDHINLIWFVAFLAGGLASRALLTVVLCDYLLALICEHHALAKQRQGTPLENAIDEKLAALGHALE